MVLCEGKGKRMCLIARISFLEGGRSSFHLEKCAQCMALYIF